ncbi:right-handed parallel beta-helix repeat-containing protein [Paenibacillus kribbensis]|uniref:right-handed parallel beta-helix repeat-containing protein n=1 Tax=Paenibacillus kribbensis TaxID=172713 RepID=UPI002DBBA5E7|nr:right-handed parallel beta-helix repeat-containing protein [Paenibacillus kribbensis]MEC0233739.1 right-handed parallel beta-helix repeat-containing protein [Paenibacillus kribbensis]
MEKMYPPIVNSPKTELSELVTDTQTEITVLNASVLLQGEGIAVLGNGDVAETITYTSIEDNTLKGCVRGFEGVARAWASGAVVARNFTASDLRAAQRNIEALDDKLQGMELTDAYLYYVDAVNGSDNSDGLTKAKAFKTIAKAVSVMKPISLSRFSIILLPGTYDEDVEIKHKLRAQTMELKGETEDASLYKVKSIVVDNFMNRAGISNLTITATEQVGISLVYCNRILIQNVVIEGASTQHGISSYDANARIVNCKISNRNIGIAADARSWFYIENCTGSGNVTGIQSQLGSIIVVAGTAPKGTADEKTTLSGLVFGNIPFTYLKSGLYTLPANSTPADVPITAIIEDSYNMRVGNTVLISKSGWYHINLLATIESLPNNKIADITVYKNGSNLTTRQGAGLGTGLVTFLTMDDQQYLVAGDVISFKVFQSDAAEHNVYNTQMRLTCIGQRRT